MYSIVGSGFILFVLCSNIEVDPICSIGKIIGRLFSSRKFHDLYEWNSRYKNKFVFYMPEISFRFNVV